MTESRALALYKQSRGLSTRDQQTDLYGANNMFGTIAGQYGRLGSFNSQFGFLPSDANGGTIDLTGDNIDVQARWLGLSSTQMQYWAYNYCAPLSTVIDRLAEADSNGRIEFRDSDDATLKKEKVNKIPNLRRIKRLF